MGTNFYMLTKNKKMVKKYFAPEEYRLIDEPYFAYEIHIGKRSGGWKPLFQEHKGAYTSVDGLLDFLNKHKDDIVIMDEYYDRVLTVKELKTELVDWGEKQGKGRVNYPNVGLINSPIDHVEISERDFSFRRTVCRYWRDKEGYNFTDAHFFA